MDEFVKIKESVDKSIEKVWEFLTKISKKKKLYPEMRNSPEKICNVTEPELLKKTFMEIIQLFEIFMQNQQNETCLN